MNKWEPVENLKISLFKKEFVGELLKLEKHAVFYVKLKTEMFIETEYVTAVQILLTYPWQSFILSLFTLRYKLGLNRSTPQSGIDGPKMCVRNRKQSIHNYAIVTVNEMIMKLTYFQQSFNQVMNMEERRHYIVLKLNGNILTT